MKMKNKDLAIGYALRQTLSDKDVQSLISDMYKARDQKVVSVYLPLANKQYEKICEDPYHEGSDKIEELCFQQADTKFLKTLESLKVLTIKTLMDDDDGEGGGMGFIANVVIKRPEYIAHLYEWIKDAGLILNYGIFSLHTFTGESYCLDSMYVFHTGKGLFRVFKRFLEEPTHILAYEVIYHTFQGSDKLTFGSEQVHQIIGEIREKLQMKHKLSALFRPSNDTYILRSSNV